MTGAPAFGHVRRADFLLDDDVLHLNHGGFGATPRPVLAAAASWRARMEADPTTFFRRDLLPLLRAAAGRVAQWLGGEAGDWAFVENATAGSNAIVASLGLNAGDEIVCLSQVYGALANTIAYHAGRAGARVVTVKVPVPFTDPQPLLVGLKAALGRHTRLAMLDHVTSAGATVLPVAAMAAICRDAGVPVAIDGAHAPGMLAFDVPALGVDWYVGNLHKWGFAPKGCAVVWCAPARQERLHPVAISHALGQGFTAEFDYTGTRDNSAWLAVPEAIAYLDGLGSAAVRRHNRALACEAGDMLAEAWGTEVAAAPEFGGAMAAVRLPGRFAGRPDVARRLAERLHDEHRIVAGVTVLDGGLWLRISAQVYNEAEDYRGLAAIGRLLAP
jgi:isopenicillin-N epimerase